MSQFKNKTYIITGASRGIGADIARKLAEQGANIVLIAKTSDPHPKLPGTIHTVAAEVEELGGKALPIQLDVRDIDGVHAAVKQTVETFGGIDGLINNASALNITDTLNTPMKRFDLMVGVNVRATFAFSQACNGFLKKSANPHILILSPPINLDPKWFKDHLAYTISKYGMSMCTLGLSAEFSADKIAVNSLWPKTIIATAAVKNNFPADVYKATRKPGIVSDAAMYILSQPSTDFSGQFCLDEDILKTAGEKDFDKYATNPGVAAMMDLYV